jgi:hypothetical protein
LVCISGTLLSVQSNHGNRLNTFSCHEKDAQFSDAGKLALHTAYFICDVEVLNDLYGIEIKGMSNQTPAMFLIKLYLQGHGK